MNVYELLTGDHKKTKSLFSELEDTDEAQVQKRKSPFAKLIMELTVHAGAEEKLFYSRLKDTKESREITLESLEEYKVMKRLSQELDANSVASEEWEAKLEVLFENSKHPIQEEERELFPKARKVLSEEEAEEIEEFKSRLDVSPA